MNTCDTCQFWGFNTDLEYPFKNDDGTESKYCDVVNGQIEEYPISAICRTYGESIMTGPKFGCIHWKGKHDPLS